MLDLIQYAGLLWNSCQVNEKGTRMKRMQASRILL